MKALRCAIYTRKSTEEGLEQGFNSLHAQREAFAGLGQDIGLAGLPLSMQTVEALLQTFLGGFTSVDGAAGTFHARGAFLCPKNRGPFHFVPVMAKATWLREAKSRPR